MRIARKPRKQTVAKDKKEAIDDQTRDSNR